MDSLLPMCQAKNIKLHIRRAKVLVSLFISAKNLHCSLSASSRPKGTKQSRWRDVIILSAVTTRNQRTDLEISEFETVWAEITLPNSKPFLICSIYHPPDACSSWIDLFDNEITKAQTTSLELILMGDFNIDYSSSCNNKWNNLVQLFDLSQLVSKLIRVTASTTTIIDHVYTTHKGNITECFVPHYAISDHYPVCFTRKIDHKIRKCTHSYNSYLSMF